MQENDWLFTKADWDEAHVSNNEKTLHDLSCHTSRFVRAAVAGNRYCPLPLRQQLALDTSRGVVMWLIGNPALTKSEYDAIFYASQNKGYCDVVTPALARSALADLHQLDQLTHWHTWNVQLEILNNYRGRGDDYRQLLSRYLAKADTEYRDWTELEKLAHFRTYNTRLPIEENSE